MPLHSQRQRFQSAKGQKTVERTGDRANCVLQERNLVGQLLVFPNYDHAPDHIGVAVQIFCRRMNHHIESGFNRTLEPWASESIVGNAQNFSLARDLGDRLDIDQLQQRVARCFDPNHPRIRLDRFL